MRADTFVPSFSDKIRVFMCAGHVGNFGSKLQGVPTIGMNTQHSKRVAFRFDFLDPRAQTLKRRDAAVGEGHPAMIAMLSSLPCAGVCMGALSFAVVEFDIKSLSFDFQRETGVEN